MFSCGEVTDPAVLIIVFRPLTFAVCWFALISLVWSQFSLKDNVHGRTAQYYAG